MKQKLESVERELAKVKQSGGSGSSKKQTWVERPLTAETIGEFLEEADGSLSGWSKCRTWFTLPSVT